jgi:predicted DNA binding CopG/RHH family protein
MNSRKKPMAKLPKFANDDEEAAWWASAEGRAFVKQQSASGSSRQKKGSTLATGLHRATSVQIALRLPAPDVEKAREIAERKGIGYQTLLKMLVHEGLRREARRL